MYRLILLLMIGNVAFLSFAYAEPSPLRSLRWKNLEKNKEKSKEFDVYFQQLINKPFDNLAFKIQLELVAKELFSQGYFRAEVKPKVTSNEKETVVEIEINLNERVDFHFAGASLFTYQELRGKVLEKIKNEFGKIESKNLENFLAEQYEEAGFYNTRVRIREAGGWDLQKNRIKSYFFTIEEGKKIKIREINYRGLSAISREEVQKIYDKYASPLADGLFYDKTFFDKFSDILKKEYLSRGFVFAEVSKHRIINHDDDKTISVEFGIVEKQQVILRKISFTGVPEDLIFGIKERLKNKEGRPVNIVEMENDLREMVIYFQGEGYYFATISNLNSNTLIVYDRNYGAVELNPEITLDRKICFNEPIINGNTETESRVIYREIGLQKGELITPAKLESLRQKLSGLNLFSSLRITPYILYEETNPNCPKTNLIIQVKEKEFGLVEIAPGFRTDLGAKLSTGITYNNINGMNRSISLRLLGNKRFNLDGFDERRKRENKDLVEYAARLSMTEPYLFNTYLKNPVEFEFSSSFQRTRYYGFDANVFRVSPQISKNSVDWKWLSTSVRYQFERIVQFDATEVKDNDNFSIGGITPSLTFDFRDDPVKPKKGTFFTLSSEWANSRFGSMKDENLEVNFVKVISRNRFYYSMGNFTLALSLAGGYQKNFADELLKDSQGNIILNNNGIPKTRGFIPSIKVFRLDSYDEIRGYDDGEANRIFNGTPIGEIVVQNEAYFTTLKFEPRYNLSDTLQLSLFFDAGRVFVNNFDPIKLRTSVGIGFKYLTPVGSLDFDYGFKLQRKTYPDKVKDSGSRFHLSIGFF